MGLTAPNTAAAKEYQPSVYTAWTVPSVRSALAMHEAGDFSQSAILADHIWRDDRFFSTIQTLVLGVLGLPFCIDESDEVEESEKEQAAAIAKRVKGWWLRAIPEDVLGDVIRCVVPMGFAVGENVWAADETTGELRPKHKIHNLEFVRWREDIKSLVLTTTTGEEVITPGNGRWVVWTSSASDRPWMTGAIRALAIPFLIRSFVRRDWARRSEIEGIGVRKAGVPDDPKPENVDRFLESVAVLGTETTLKLPPGYTFEIEAADLGAAEGFEKLLAHCDTGMTLPILGQNLTTQIEGGSYAAATVHARVQLDRIESAVAMLATTARNQILEPWGLYNIPGFRREMAPWPRYDATPPEDQQKVAQAHLTLAQAITSLKTLGIDTAPIVERFGLTFLESGAEEKAPIYAYHIAAGALTINEIRKTLGLPQVSWGDERAGAAAQPTQA